jgi:N-acetylneuraminic acid mutarotase
MEDRVHAQRAIEEVYWRHRIWPGENRGGKPPLDAVLSEAQLRAKVEDYLRKSNAAEEVWGRPITAPQLQAEMERMAKQTRAPEVLQEIFAALGDDPGLIAETLARQTLADRLVRGWYARDERFHGGVRRRAEAALAGVSDATRLRTLGAEYSETTWRFARPDGAKDESPSETKQGAIVLDAAEWREQVTRLAEMLDAGHDKPPAEQTLEGLPLMTVSRLREEDGAFVVTGLLRRGQGTFTTATAWWPKTSFDRWWSGGSEFTGALTAPAPGNFERVTVAAEAPCIPDSWTPDGRSNATAVWTGSEMIVWGGSSAHGAIFLNDGGRYNPSTDSWVAITTDGAPAARIGHSAVWTGSEMIVWGGSGPSLFSDGGRYDPSTNSWVDVITFDGSPAARTGHTAVWTGSEMIVWGGTGDGGNYLIDGGRYDPSTYSWLPTGTSGAPSGRSSHTAVWTGTEMIVWGGAGASYLNDGGRYNASTDSWLPTTTTGAPSGRRSHTAVWTGSEMIVWGGYGGGYLNDGGRYDPSTDSWVPTTTSGAPAGRWSHTAVWTGSEMIVWGGRNSTNIIFNDGGRYNPSTESWLPTATSGAPAGHYSHTAVWTGIEMIVWGGSGAAGDAIDGGRYSPTTDSWVPTTHNWVPTTTSGAPVARAGHTAVWTGSEMIVWGGSGTGDGGRYNPSTDSWTPTTTTGAPAARAGHTAVWTGSELIVWGGSNGSNLFNDGGRYNPSTDNWVRTTTTGAPARRSSHTAVWTGSEMIVWGGAGASYLNDGGRYDPYADSWVPTGTSGAPVARFLHTAVWTGSEMIVWGGTNDPPYPLNSGGRYRPSTNTWLSTGLSFQNPSARFGHTAVWTGSEMIIWGGTDGQYFYYRDGGRYNPSTNGWMPTKVGFIGVPATRAGHTAVWTGSEMIVWGGYGGGYLNNGYLGDGWRYSPSSDSWVQTATSGAPSARSGSTSVWTSNEMIVWGGSDGGVLNSGGRYCVASCPTWYRDGDGDGYGASSVPQVACVRPPGVVPMPGDCNDANPAAHPGAAEICDGIDDNCNGLIDEDANGTDSDGDGVQNACDNCPTVPNAGQGDFNHDLVGDACDLNDGLILVTMPDQITLAWQLENGFESFNIYRGDLAVLKATGIYTQDPTAVPLATRRCGFAEGSAEDDVAPPPGRGVFYLLTGTHNGVESTLGTNSAGVTRPNTNPCP